ncbi:MAG: PAS domain-containing protein [Rubricoccaceae bacterium]
MPDVLCALLVEPDDDRYEALRVALEDTLPFAQSGLDRPVRALDVREALETVAERRVAVCFAPAYTGPDPTASLTLALARGAVFVPVVAVADEHAAGLEAVRDEGAADYVLRRDLAAPETARPALARALAVAQARREAVLRYREERAAASAIAATAGAVYGRLDAEGRLAVFRPAPHLAGAFAGARAGQLFASLFPDDLADTVEALLPAARRAPQTFLQRTSASGEPLVLRWSVAAAEPGGYVVVGLDDRPVTQSSERAEAIGRVLDVVLRHAPVVVFITDADGRLLMMSGRGCEERGPAMLGESVFEVFRGEHHGLDNIRRVLEEQEAFSDIVTTREGTRYDVYYTPFQIYPESPMGMLGVAVDISDSQRASDTITLLRAALDLTGVPASTASPQGVPTYFNTPMQDFVGGTPEEVDAAGGFAALHDDPSVLRPIAATVRGGEAWSGTIRQRTLGGRVVPATLHTKPVFSSEGERLGSVSVMYPDGEAAERAASPGEA